MGHGAALAVCTGLGDGGRGVLCAGGEVVECRLWMAGLAFERQGPGVSRFLALGWAVFPSQAPDATAS